MATSDVNQSVSGTVGVIRSDHGITWQSTESLPLSNACLLLQGPYRLDRAQACSELQSFFVQEPAFANAAPTLTLHDFELTGSASYPDWLHNQTELTFRVEPMVGSLPVGAKVLYGEDSGYIIAPLGNLVDERYTAYFSFAGY